jgi:hypothetical protein
MNYKQPLMMFQTHITNYDERNITEKKFLSEKEVNMHDVLQIHPKLLILLCLRLQEKVNCEILPWPPKTFKIDFETATIQVFEYKYSTYFSECKVKRV